MTDKRFREYVAIPYSIFFDIATDMDAFIPDDLIADKKYGEWFRLFYYWVEAGYQYIGNIEAPDNRISWQNGQKVSTWALFKRPERLNSASRAHRDWLNQDQERRLGKEQK